MSTSSSSNGSTIYTETLLWKYLDHLTLLPHCKRILIFLNKQNNTFLYLRSAKCVHYVSVVFGDCIFMENLRIRKLYVNFFSQSEDNSFHFIFLAWMILPLLKLPILLLLKLRILAPPKLRIFLQIRNDNKSSR